MEVYRTKKFRKAFKKLNKKQKNQAQLAIEKFINDPFDPVLRNHALKGRMKGQRAFSAANDLRIIYREEKDHIVVIMLDVGKHAQVY